MSELIEEIAVELLRAPDKNPNVMGTEVFEKLVRAIKKFGFLQPVCVNLNRHPDGSLDGYTVIDGYHRVEAAKEAGLESIPCVVIEVDEADAKSIQIGMNRMRGELDLAKVGQAMEELIEEGWGLTDLELTGFDAKEIETLLDAVRSDGESMMAAQLPNNEPEPSLSEQVPKPFLLEIEFAEKKQLTKVKRALKKAAGGSTDFGVGLLRIIGEEV